MDLFSSLSYLRLLALAFPINVRIGGRCLQSSSINTRQLLRSIQPTHSLQPPTQEETEKHKSSVSLQKLLPRFKLRGIHLARPKDSIALARNPGFFRIHRSGPPLELTNGFDETSGSDEQTGFLPLSLWNSPTQKTSTAELCGHLLCGIHRSGPPLEPMNAFDETSGSDERTGFLPGEPCSHARGLPRSRVCRHPDGHNGNSTIVGDCDPSHPTSTVGRAPCLVGQKDLPSRFWMI
ncbi:hypothetical protein ACLOJK_024537 [Asimina triloba]